MKRRFNVTGLCVPNMHYMADTRPQINEIFERFIEYGEYFTINRGNQFGKTTTIFLLSKLLEKKDNYLLIETSFEAVSSYIFENEEAFAKGFLMNLHYRYESSQPKLADEFKIASEKMTNFDSLSKFITNFVEKTQKKIVVIIDEVDKSSNNQLFLRFLGLLREKYLKRNRAEDKTFHSVILAGVTDIKTLKLKIREDEQERINSPWNIAADFDINLTFRPNQIVSLLADYQTEHPNIKIPKQEVADLIYYYTNGYPFLVSLMCKTIDEKIISKREDKNWTINDVEESFKKIVYPGYTTTLFDSIAKNLINNPKLYKFISNIVIDNDYKLFALNDPIISLANTYSIIKDANGCKIHNRIFEQRIYDLMLSIMDNDDRFISSPTNKEYYEGNGINLEYILQKFQKFFKDNYSKKDIKFIEREGRLIFLSYLQPIINSTGYIFKEPVTGEDKSMDIVITYKKERYIIELKIWQGEKFIKKGLDQLIDYLDKYSLTKGYLLIFDFNKKKQYKHENIKIKDKEIFAIYV